jgi:hypothetical protein
MKAGDLKKTTHTLPNFEFWQRWLFTIGLVIVVFGVLMVCLSGTPLFNVFNNQINPAFWGSDPPSVSIQRFQQWVYGVWGATIAGWGVTISFVAKHAFKTQEPWSWRSLVTSILAWFVLDTLVSVVLGVYFNVVFNTVLLILVGLPIAFTSGTFTRHVCAAKAPNKQMAEQIYHHEEG